MGFCHHHFFSVSVESLAMNFCSQTGASGPGQGGGFALPSPPGRGQSAESPEWLRGDRRARGRQVCPCPTLRGSGLSIWWNPGEDKAGLGELTFSSGLTRTRAHGSILGLDRGQSLLTLLGTSLGLQGAGAALHTLGEAEVAVVGTVVKVSQPRQGQDVVTGNPQDGQFGQLLPI